VNEAVQALPTEALLQALFVFVLAAFVGYEVVSKVPTMLHTPLMSGANAVHGVIVVGAMLVAASAEGPLVNAKLRAALSFARKLTEGPRRMAQADADALYAAGWDERALYDIVSVTALYNLYNRLVEGLGVEAGPEYYRAAAERLTKAVREPRA